MTWYIRKVLSENGYDCLRQRYISEVQESRVVFELMYPVLLIIGGSIGWDRVDAGTIGISPKNFPAHQS